MKQFRLVDNVLGWVAFLIAAFVYCSTIEPTASFWDCPEFITTGYKLEIGHPPGSPFFALTANLFSQFASDPSQVARMVNTMSALLSAACIMFLFWTITHLARKLMEVDDEIPTLSRLIAIEASGMVGALIYTFSDTFWFSAVEGEVYAYSSAFTAVVFWLILKWEDHADEPHSDRWLVLITYMTGLSIGVHLLNLLCIPAIVLVYYYKKVPYANLKGSLAALAVSVVLVAAVLYGVVPGIITVGGTFELFFTNTLGMPFNTGTIVYLVLLISSFAFAIWATFTGKSLKMQNIAFLVAVSLIGIPFYGYGWKALLTGAAILVVLGFVLYNKKTAQLVSARVKNTALLCMLMLMIGYSTYAVIVIRSMANPTMDQNSPEDIFTLGSYLSRDQYGNRPLFYGQAYTSEPDYEEIGNGYMRAKTVITGDSIWEKREKASADEPDRYFGAGIKRDQVWKQNMFFPRMYDAAHASHYEQWMGGVTGHMVEGMDEDVKMPTQWENLKFFLSYQCNFMYWRYFMWNFAGRQNDIQGNGELEHGNWITGISFIDNAMYGDQSKLPDELKNNKGHNVFYCLPLLLGLIGLFWQAFRGQRGIQQFWVVFFLFFMTGLAIVIYLNQTPSQPRERDYAYAGSFYAYAIWCGLGVISIIDLLKKKLKIKGVAVASIVALLTLLVPIQMASQTWDDHDRSDRYTCSDFGYNYLMSLQDKGAPIIFTNGDNDTFPLWYNQEVEGKRTDTRVCNLSYLSTDWYIDQMRRPAYNSPSVPITWSRLQYISGTNDYVTINTDMKQSILELYKDPKTADMARMMFGDKPFELKNVLKYWIRGEFSAQQKQAIGAAMDIRANEVTQKLHFIPSDTLYVTIDKDAVRKSGMMMPSDSIPDEMAISLTGKNALYKNDLMMLEMIAQSNWVRPLYVAITVGSENFMNLGDNFVQEGLANRITPFYTLAFAQGREGATNDWTIPHDNFDTDKTYDLVMNRFKWGGLSKPGLYLDPTVMRMCYTHRRIVSQLALQLIAHGQKDKAKKVLDKIEKEIPEYNVPMDYLSGAVDIAQAYILLGQKAKGEKILNTVWNSAKQYVDWYMSLDARGFGMSVNDCRMQLAFMQSCVTATYNNDKTWCDAHMKPFMEYKDRFAARSGQEE